MNRLKGDAETEQVRENCVKKKRERMKEMETNGKR